jgi:hypothetical protein
LEGYQDNNFTDEYELQFTNEAFNTNETDFINYTGSREVGIDVGPFDQEIVYTQTDGNVLAKGLTKKTSISGESNKNLRLIIKEANYSESAIDVPSPLRTNADKLQFEDNFDPSPNSNTFKNMTENERNDHLTAKYLELAENNVNKLSENSLKKASSTSTSNKPVNSNSKNIPERESEEKSEADDESELKIIFSKVIEENLSELFAPYKSEHLGLDLAPEKKKAIFIEEEKTAKPAKANKEAARNDKMRAAAPLGFSSSHKLQHGESDDSSSTKTVTQDKNTFEDRRNDFNKSSSSNENEPEEEEDDEEEDQDNLEISIESDENEYRAIESNAFKKATRVESHGNFESKNQKSDFMDTLEVEKNSNVNNGYENEFEGNFKS